MYSMYLNSFKYNSLIFIVEQCWVELCKLESVYSKITVLGANF